MSRAPSSRRMPRAVPPGSYPPACLKRLSLGVNTRKQRVEGVDELVHPLLLQLLSDLIIVDPDVRECSKLRLRHYELVLDGEAHPAMPAETLDRGEGHSVHRV